MAAAAQPAPPTEPPHYAGWWSRVAASIVDTVVVLAIVAVCFVPAGLVSDLEGVAGDAGSALLLGTGIVAAFLYAPAAMARTGSHNGKTLGKQALGIRVVRADRAPVGWGVGLVRELLVKGVIGQITFGIFTIVDSVWPLFHAQNRALHDLMASTFVLRA